jgi:hypothetical protein
MKLLLSFGRRWLSSSSRNGEGERITKDARISREPPVARCLTKWTSNYDSQTYYLKKAKGKRAKVKMINNTGLQNKERL